MLKHIMMMMMMMMMTIIIMMMNCLTNERRTALFPAGTIMRDPHHHRETSARREQDLNLRRARVQVAPQIVGNSRFPEANHQYPKTSHLRIFLGGITFNIIFEIIMKRDLLQISLLTKGGLK